MELRVTHEDGYVLASTVGAIDDSAEGLLREYLHPLLSQAGTKVVLDLSQSKFINSRGIGQLVLLAVHANSDGCRVILAAPTPFVSVVFARSKLDRYFEMAETVPQAITAILNQPR